MAHTPNRKWLIVKLADIGDLLTITPALARLRTARPQDVIHVLTTGHSAPVLPDSLVDGILTFDKFAFDRPTDLLRPGNLRAGIALMRRLRQERYDAVIIMHHLTTRFGALKYAALALASGAPIRVGLDNGRGWFLTERVTDPGFGARHEVGCWTALIDRALAQPERPPTPKTDPLQIQISSADQAKAAMLVPPPEAGPTVILHPGSGGYSLARRWDTSAFAETAQRLHDNMDARIVLVGGPQDGAEQVNAQLTFPHTNLAGQTTLGELAAVLERGDLFIGADSGVMHLAAASGIPMLALFGPSNAAAWGPWSDRAEIIRSGPACSPCSYVLSTVGAREGCPQRTCMRMITPQVVADRAHALLQGERPTNTPLTSTHPDSHDRVRILGIPLDPLTWDGLRSTLREWISGDRPRQICTVNPEFVMVAQHDVIFYNLLNRVDRCVADGQGLLWAARWLGTPLPERVTGSDGVPRIAAWAAAEGWRIFLLGAAEGVAAKAADILQAEHPGLQIAGTFAGSPAADEEEAIVDLINRSNADILFVAYGAPRQDKWIARNLPRLNVRVAMGVGGSLDFIVGVQKRAPQSWQRLGLEWLYRLLQEPWRWRRMTRLPRFVLAVLLRGQRGPARFEAPATRQTGATPP
ncbi:MAG: hypothetical protein Kow0077_31560 [Anaerolineae bacterium]